MWIVLYWTRSSRTQLGVSINVCRLAGDALNNTCNILYCDYQVHRHFLITLYVSLTLNILSFALGTGYFQGKAAGAWCWSSGLRIDWSYTSVCRLCLHWRAVGRTLHIAVFPRLAQLSNISTGNMPYPYKHTKYWSVSAKRRSGQC
jgi:hypothetical protein